MIEFAALFLTVLQLFALLFFVMTKRKSVEYIRMATEQLAHTAVKLDSAASEMMEAANQIEKETESIVRIADTLKREITATEKIEEASLRIGRAAEAILRFKRQCMYDLDIFTY